MRGCGSGIGRQGRPAGKVWRQGEAARILTPDVLGNTMRFSLLIVAGLLPVTAVAQTPRESTAPQYLGPLQMEELRKKGLIDDDPSDDPPPSEECVQALKDIDRERAASDRALRRGEAEPVDLKQSYEQDMYYAD